MVDWVHVYEIATPLETERERSSGLFLLLWVVALGGGLVVVGVVASFGQRCERHLQRGLVRVHGGFASPARFLQGVLSGRRRGVGAARGDEGRCDAFCAPTSPASLERGGEAGGKVVVRVGRRRGVGPWRCSPWG